VKQSPGGIIGCVDMIPADRLDKTKNVDIIEYDNKGGDTMILHKKKY